jgi:hypothetical protein
VIFLLGFVSLIVIKFGKQSSIIGIGLYTALEEKDGHSA